LPSHCEESGPSAADRYCTKEPNDATHAGWEEDLGTHAVRAVVLEEVVALLPGLVARVVIIVVEADERDGLVLKVGGIVRAAVGAAGNHLEACRRGDDLLVLGARPLKVAARGSQRRGRQCVLPCKCDGRKDALSLDVTGRNSLESGVLDKATRWHAVSLRAFSSCHHRAAQDGRTEGS
jgi:hypothetical protein